MNCKAATSGRVGAEVNHIDRAMTARTVGFKGAQDRSRSAGPSSTRRPAPFAAFCPQDPGLSLATHKPLFVALTGVTSTGQSALTLEPILAVR